MAEAIELMEGLSDANPSHPEQGIKSADTTRDDETNSPKSTAKVVQTGQSSLVDW